MTEVPVLKTCRTCLTEFPSGLTCPSCGAFVVDPPGWVEPDSSSRPEAATPTEPAEPDHPKAGSLGGWVVPTSDVVTPRPAATEPPPADPAPTTALARPAPGSLGGWVTPAAPAAPADKPSAPIEEPPSLTSAPRPRDAGPAPFTARGAEGAATPTRPTPEPTRPRAPAPAPVAPTPEPDRPTAPAWSPAAPPAPPADGTFERYPDSLIRPAPARDPKMIVAAAALLVVLVLGGIFLLRPKDSSTGQLGDLAGTCFRYNADHTILDRSVPCTDRHDGKVLTYVTDQSACPPDTSAILTAKGDSAGANGVLCVDERS